MTDFPVNSDIFQDWDVNRGNYRSGFVLVFFRLVQAARKSQGWNWAAKPLGGMYEVIVIWLLGIELNHPRMGGDHGCGCTTASGSWCIRRP